MATAALLSSYGLDLVTPDPSPQAPKPRRLRVPRASIRPKPKALYPALDNLLDPLISHPSIPATVCWSPAPVRCTASNPVASAEEPAWHIYPTICNLHAAQPLSVQAVLPSLYLLSTLPTHRLPMQSSVRSFPIPKANIFVHAGLGPRPGCSRSGNPLPASNHNPSCH